MRTHTIEVWKAIRDYEGLYEVSNWGNVKSVERTIIRGNGRTQTIKERILRPTPNSDGYLKVRLSKNGVPETKFIHKLVAEAFIENPHGYDIVHHINHDRSDNRLENFEWIDEHEHDAMHAAERGEQLSKTVYQYTLDGLLVNVWKSIAEAARTLGFNNSAICNCCLGKRKTHKGYQWSYVPL